MLKEALTPESFLFWVLFVVLSGMIFATMPTRKNIPLGWGIGATLGFIALLILFGPRSWLERVRHDPLIALAWFGGYVAIGVGVGCWLWDAFLLKRRSKLADTEREWMSQNHSDRGEKVPDDLIPEFRDFLKNDPYWYVEQTPRRTIYQMVVGDYNYRDKKRVLRIVPRPWHYKQQWFAWAAWWPWSGTYYVAVELLANTFMHAWNLVAGQLERWSFYRFRDYKKFEE